MFGIDLDTVPPNFQIYAKYAPCLAKSMFCSLNIYIMYAHVINACIKLLKHVYTVLVGNNNVRGKTLFS